MKPCQTLLSHSILGVTDTQMDLILANVLRLPADSRGFSYMLSWELLPHRKRTVTISSGFHRETIYVENCTLLQTMEDFKREYGTKLDVKGNVVECTLDEIYFEVAKRDVKRVFRNILTNHYNGKILELSSW
jgi:hypothetical protein